MEITIAAKTKNSSEVPEETIKGLTPWSARGLRAYFKKAAGYCDPDDMPTDPKEAWLVAFEPVPDLLLSMANQYGTKAGIAHLIRIQRIYKFMNAHWDKLVERELIKINGMYVALDEDLIKALATEPYTVPSGDEFLFDFDRLVQAEA